MDRTQTRLLILVILLGLTVLFVHTMPLGSAIPLKNDSKSFPIVVGEWTKYDISQNDGIPTPNVDEYIYRSYRNGANKTVFCYIGYLAKFRYGNNIFAGDYVTPGYGWARTKEREEIRKVNGKTIRIKEIVFEKDGKCKSIFYSYYTNRGAIIDRDKGRFYYALDALLNRNTNVALIRVSSVPLLSQDCAFSTNEELFINELLPYLAKFLPFE